MKKLVFAASLALAVAACDNAAEEADNPEVATADVPPSATSMVGTYEVTMPDGTKGTSMLMEDGRYMDRFGDQAEDGTWSDVEDKTCFDPDGEEEPVRCYTLGEPAADGTFTATPDGGEPVKVKKLPE